MSRYNKENMRPQFSGIKPFTCFACTLPSEKQYLWTNGENQVVSVCSTCTAWLLTYEKKYRIDLKQPLSYTCGNCRKSIVSQDLFTWWEGRQILDSERRSVVCD